MTRALALFMIFVASACGDGALEPTRVAADVLIAPAGVDARLAGAATPPTASLDGSRLRVLGATGAERCDTIDPRLYVDGTTVTIRVRAARNPDGCLAAPGSWQYEIAYPLPAGSYRVRVLHRVFDAPERVMLDAAVAVP